MPPIVRSISGADSRGSCLRDLLAVPATHSPEAVAVAAPGRRPLSFAKLLRQAEQIGVQLNELGLGPGDRVAIALPNGPEMAVAFFAVACAATAAPLNPAYRAEEFEFYLGELRPKALLLAADIESPARSAARKGGIPVIGLAPSLEEEAGLFTLSGRKAAASASRAWARPGDVALALPTSGTTSRPKIVPLTHANLCRSASNIVATLSLRATDRCLNVMPLFHIHGLVGAVCSSWAAGASVVCPPGFHGPQFFEWMREFQPSWYTAVPTIHQAILARAPANGEIIARCPLRFIRSSSAALPPPVMAELEAVFGAPVIESYGMTEAAHQMASNPLPPRPRKPGSVGIAAGPEIGIMGEPGALLGAGQRGEIVIRGANVTSGYADNTAANEAAFAHGWFHTGDQGYLDDEGYLFVTGRLKEIINRGGEKISPREVDEVLLQHPAVAQAVTFAMPDAQLGEEVAAAVVLREDRTCSERALREFVGSHLADFKVPRRILLLPEIPKGPTGKLQRIGLAKKLGLAAPRSARPRQKADFVAPRTPLEQLVAGVWSEVLGRNPIGVNDHFLDLGGDSILATQILARLNALTETELSPLSFFEAPTVAGVSLAVASRQEQQSHPPALLLELDKLSDEEAERLLAEELGHRAENDPAPEPTPGQGTTDPI